MAYIKKRGAYWRAEVQRKGHKSTYRTFDTQLEAQKWARRVKAEIDTGFYVDNSAAEKMTLGEALKQYRHDVAAKKRHPAQEYGRIDRWLRNDLCFRTLANLKGQISHDTEISVELKGSRKTQFGSIATREPSL